MAKEGWVFFPKQRERVRQAALLRESKIRRKVNANGVIYDNITRAAQAVGLSARCIARYAQDEQKPNYFFVKDV